MSGKIYLICKDGEPKYVGFTTQSIEERWVEHVKCAKYGSKFVLHQAIRKYGPNAFVISLEVEHENEEYCLNELERLTIESYGTHVDEGGYNMTWGGDTGPSWKGKKHSPEAIAKMSAAKKGKVFSPEHRAKIGAAHKGNKHNLGQNRSPETRAKISAARKGRTFSEEHCEKLSQAAKISWAKQKEQQP